MREVLKDELERIAEILGLEVEDISQGEDFVKVEWEDVKPFSEIYNSLMNSGFYSGNFVLDSRGGFRIFVKNLPVPGKPIRISLHFDVYNTSEESSLVIDGKIFSYEYTSDKGEIVVFLALQDLKAYMDRRNQERKMETNLIGVPSVNTV